MKKIKCPSFSILFNVQKSQIPRCSGNFEIWCLPVLKILRLWFPIFSKYYFTLLFLMRSRDVDGFVSVLKGE